MAVQVELVALAADATGDAVLSWGRAATVTAASDCDEETGVTDAARFAASSVSCSPPSSGNPISRSERCAPAHRRLQPLVDLAIRKHVRGRQLVQRSGAGRIPGTPRWYRTGSGGREDRAPDDVDELPFQQPVDPRLAETPRMCSISARVTGWRYAITASVSKADWLSFTGGGSFRNARTQRQSAAASPAGTLSRVGHEEDVVSRAKFEGNFFHGLRGSAPTSPAKERRGTVLHPSAAPAVARPEAPGTPPPAAPPMIRQRPRSSGPALIPRMADRRTTDPVRENGEGFLDFFDRKRLADENSNAFRTFLRLNAMPGKSSVCLRQAASEATTKTALAAGRAHLRIVGAKVAWASCPCPTAYTNPRARRPCHLRAPDATDNPESRSSLQDLASSKLLGAE